MSLAGMGVGAFAIYHAIKDADRRIAEHLDSNLRSGVQNSCGVALTDTQWGRLTGTDEWQNFRTSLPLRGIKDTLGALRGPSLMYTAGSFAAGASLDYLAFNMFSMPENMEEFAGSIFLALTFAGFLIGRLLFLKHARQGLANVEKLSSTHPICEQARSIGLQQSGAAEVSNAAYSGTGVCAFAAETRTTQAPPRPVQKQDMPPVSAPAPVMIQPPPFPVISGCQVFMTPVYAAPLIH